jgi:nucleoside-diphosphate-sugar epimerase
MLSGATGFIGRRIQRALLGAGIPVRILMRPGSRHRQHADSRCEVLECAFSDSQGLSRAVAAVSAVVYCAGSVRGKNLDDFLPANVTGVRAILEAQASHASQAPFLLISSLAAGRPEISDYAQSKYLGEKAVRETAASPWTILRPPAVYGPGDTEMLPVLKMAGRGLIFRPGPENQRLSLLYSDDLASAVLAWLRCWRECTGQTYSIDDGCQGGYDWPAIARASGRTRFHIMGVPSPLLAAVARTNLFVSALTGHAPMLTPGKIRELTQTDWLCDNTAFSRATGWQPQTGLADGMALSLGRSD